MEKNKVQHTLYFTETVEHSVIVEVNEEFDTDLFNDEELLRRAITEDEIHYDGSPAIEVLDRERDIFSYELQDTDQFKSPEGLE